MNSVQKDSPQAGGTWQMVLTHLRQTLPRVSFDTWVRDTQAILLENGTLTVSTRNAYARDWLESHCTESIQDLLTEHSDQPVHVRFVTDEKESKAGEEAEVEQQVAIEPVQWLDYEKIVQPHKQVVVKGYLRRLGMEIGPKAIWLYIGFHQAAWRVQSQMQGAHLPLHSGLVRRFSGLSFGAFWRCLRHAGIQSQLQGLVERVDGPEERRYRRGRDGRPHRAPVRYQVYMTPRLTRADAAAVYGKMQALLAEGAMLQEALSQLLAVEDIMDLLEPMPAKSPTVAFHTVMDMTREEAGDDYNPHIDHLAQELQRRIINVLGDIHIPHYFITHTIPHVQLTPAQAWLVTVARDMAFVNARTGERREWVTFKGGYREMAELTGSSRYKTVQAWLHSQWATQQRGGNVARFLIEIQEPESNAYPDLRVESMPRTYRVLLDEPLDAGGSNMLDTNGSHMADATGNNRRTQMEGIAGADGSHMLDANGTDLNSFKHPFNSSYKSTSTPQHAPKAAQAAPDYWELEVLLQQNEVHPKVQKELLEVQASVHALVSWVLYAASPSSGKLSDPLGYALSRLREHPLREARGIFRPLADLPPRELLQLIDGIPAQGYTSTMPIHHPLADEWSRAMGSYNPRLPLVRAILYGEGNS